MVTLFFAGLPRTLALMYAKRRWLWHILAALLTWAAVTSGFDWWFFEATRLEALRPLIMVAGIGGFFVPVLAPVVLYAVGELRRKAHLVRTAAAMAQASIVAWVVVAAYKALTGRVQPDFLFDSGVDHSHIFNFGFLEYGIFWGWPSHHAAVAVAAATALFLIWQNAPVRTLALGWAAVVALGAGIGFHWFSDMLAGILIGVLAGVAAYEQQK